MSIDPNDIEVIAQTLAGEIDPRFSEYGTSENREEAANIIAAMENRYRSNSPGRFGNRTLLDVDGSDVGELDEYSSLSDVCLQKWQFSTWNDADSRAIAVANLTNHRNSIDNIIESYFDGSLLASAPSATHYHAYYVSPEWASSLTRLKKVGPHIFYEDTGVELVLDPLRREGAPEPSPRHLPDGLLLAFRSDPRRFKPTRVIQEEHEIWNLLDPHLTAQKLPVLGHTGSGFPRNKICAGALQASDAVFKLAGAEGVEMSVAVGGGSNGHSANHGGHPTGVGEAIDIKPSGGWSNLAQVYRYAELAAAAGADRLGIPHNSSGLHVQRVAVTNRPVMSWNYGSETNFEFRQSLQAGRFKGIEYRRRVAALYSDILIIDVQRALNQLGYDVSEDDEMGPQTETALNSHYGLDLTS